MSETPNGSRTARTSRPLRIVALGGGTGLSALLRGLRNLSLGVPAKGSAASGLEIAAIVTVSDDGGSSGRLRRDFNVLAPGDIRNCMVALAEDEALLAKLFQYRFPAGRGLEGHSFGNLFLLALTQVSSGDFHKAIQLSSEVLNIHGRIFPSTLQNVRLEATLLSGRSMVGETRITGSRDGIRRVRLRPRSCKPAPGALSAIARADLITLGPGSLYTSVIPNLLVDGIAEAIEHSRAAKVYVSNLMWEPGETEEYFASDHLRAIYEHSREGLVDYMIVNDRPVPPRARKRYAEQNSRPVEVDPPALEDLGVTVMGFDLLARGGKVRHDPGKLAAALVSLAGRRRSKRR